MILILLLFQAWVNKAPMVTPRYGFGTAVVGDQVYAIGGRTASGYVSTVESYHTVGDSWSSGYAPMPTARYNFGCVVYGGRIYAIGGRKTGPGPSIIGRVERYDPASNVWDSCRTMPTAREGLVCVTYRDRILAIGGYTMGMGGRYVRTVESFDPQTGTWTAIDSLNVARAGAASTVLDDTVYAMCGGQFSPLNSLESHAGGAWFGGPSLNRSRVGAGAAVHNGYMYVCGGEVPSESVYNSIEIFDRSNRVWNFGLPMNQARSHQGTAAVGGNLYVFGGKALSNVLGSSEGLGLNVAEVQTARARPKRILPALLRGVLHIRLPGPGWRAEVFDAAGRCVARHSTGRARSHIELPPGVYFVRLAGGGEETVEKILVVR